jgi:hypothetical protein
LSSKEDVMGEACGVMGRKAYRILAGKPEKKRPH